MVQEYWIWFWGKDIAIILPICLLGVFAIWVICKSTKF
jgi:hypothetical protein